MTNEEQYWADKAALLDPSCYVYIRGTNWSITVPAGKVYYLANAWNLTHYNGNHWHLRNLSQPFQVSQGFIFKAGNEMGFAYYADPSIVQDVDSRYQIDPKGLYFERLAKLRTILMETISVNRPAGTLYNDLMSIVPFPTSCERIMLRHFDCHDGSWMTLMKPDFSAAMNTQDELDDIRPMRFTDTMHIPILRSQFPNMMLGHGTTSGYGQPQTYNGYGTVRFQRLPSDW